jgi:hypothetical protein
VWYILSGEEVSHNFLIEHCNLDNMSDGPSLKINREKVIGLIKNSSSGLYNFPSFLTTYTNATSRSKWDCPIPPPDSERCTARRCNFEHRIAPQSLLPSRIAPVTV